MVLNCDGSRAESAGDCGVGPWGVGERIKVLVCAGAGSAGRGCIGEIPSIVLDDRPAGGVFGAASGRAGGKSGARWPSKVALPGGAPAAIAARASLPTP